MSKESALGILTGKPVESVNHSLITGEIPKTGLADSTAPATPLESAPPQEVQPTEALSAKQFAIFAKKEAALQAKTQEFKRQQAEYEAKAKEVEAVRGRAKQFDELMKTDRIAAFKLLGFSEADLFNVAAEAQNKPKTPEQIAREAAQEELGKFKTEQERAQSEAQQKRDEEVIARFKSDIGSALRADPELKFCNHYGEVAQEMAYDIVDEVLKAEGIVISPKEALELAEKYYKNEYESLSKLGGVKEPVVEAPATEPAKTLNKPLARPNQPPAKPKVLTNQASVTVASTIQRRETPQEKRARLEEALRRGSL